MILTALTPTNPVAMMAAYGALRLLPKARIRWVERHPELEFEGDIASTLAALVPDRLEAPEIAALDDPRDKPIGGTEGYRGVAASIPAGWLHAYAAETGGEIRGSSLLMLGGNHKFVDNARRVIGGLARSKDIASKIEEALAGPWRYEDRSVQAWGWDASSRMEAAAASKEVNKVPKWGVAGAYWLAWESLPLWPMIDRRTVGMTRESWRYPIVSEWLDLTGLRMLILSQGRLSERETRALGVTWFEAPRLRSGLYGHTLGWGRVTLQGAARTSSCVAKRERFADVTNG